MREFLGQKFILRKALKCVYLRLV
ncbi:hypothetical protein Golax_021248 [Gossypium laxum]|uniref:Uncharacterized protein n=1 Tax=Gossypium laxum TaxID=34288 RepID=A0A7J9AKE8_9ROSI|nr:hypothetical protein [Gossypium laxum]